MSLAVQHHSTQNCQEWGACFVTNLDRIHSFHWHVHNATIPCRSHGAYFNPLCYLPFPSTLFHQLVFHPPSLHLVIYYLALLFPNSYIILFGEFYFLPFSVHAQTNVIYLTLLSLL